MKKELLLSVCLTVLLVGEAFSQTYLPIATNGYSLDAVAENTTALSTTGGGLDGGGHVMYSAAYGALYGGSATGVPNNGLISAGTRTYQLQPYTGANVIHMFQSGSDSLNFTTPASYPGISLLAFSTDGNATADIKVRFTDNTTQTFTSVSITDWYDATFTLTAGYDRCTRSTGTPDYAGPAGNPKFHYVDLPISCANRLKNIQRIVFVNSSAARLVILAASGAMAPVLSATSSPVTCAGGTNGTGTISVVNGVPPFTYTWPGQLAQNSNTGSVLPPGNVTYTVTDAASCQFTATVFVGQNIVPTAPITITATPSSVCSGYSMSLTSDGASTYTWSNNGNTSSTIVFPVGNNPSFSVVATTSDNCTVTGSITVSTIPLPVVTFTFPPKLCINAQPIALSGSPAGGFFSGNAVSFNNFYASQAGAGTHTIGYTYTDANGCANQGTVSTIVSTPTTVINFTITPLTICSGAPALTLSAQPAGGTFTGSGVTPGGIFSPAIAGLGTRTVSYIFTDSNNCTGSKVSGIDVIFCSSVGLAEIQAGSGFEIYPNPGNGNFTIVGAHDVELVVVDQTGQVVGSVKCEAAVSQLLNLEHLASGIYFIISADGSVKQKVAILH